MITKASELPALPPIPPMTTSDPALQSLCDAMCGFCTDEVQVNGFSFDTPWVRDGLLYATNGYTIARFDVRNGRGSSFVIREPANDPARRPRDPGASFRLSNPLAWINAPPYSPCSRCGATGTFECESCGHKESCNACRGTKETVSICGVMISIEVHRKLDAFRKVGLLQVSHVSSDKIAFRVLGTDGAVVVDGVCMGMAVVP